MLGIGGQGIKKFCGLMDLPKPGGQTTYDALVKNIHCAASSVCENSMKSAAKEEINLTAEADNIEKPRGLTVSGYATRSKKGLFSLYGVASLIGYHSGKVLDVAVKSAYCNECESMKTKANTAEYEEWNRRHQCDVNHEGSADKMEVDAVREMFSRSQELHDVKYLNYVADGDCKIFKDIAESNPYDESVKKKERIERVPSGKNESLDDLIWQIAPKTNFSNAKINEIAAFVATTIFNDGHRSLLDILRILNVSIGPRTHDMCVEEDVSRVSIGNVD
nr:uncharacterized protein LOC124216275 [Neodiprion pinetum]